MGSGRNLNTEVFREQARYIRLLEEQLAVYEEKDRVQELLIGELSQALEILAEELSKAKGEKE